jgi:methionyl-tRNA formyltransferase
LLEDGRDIPRHPQGPGKTATKKELLELMPVSPDDDSETIDRKVRAFWYPPQTGATIEIAGREFTLVNQDILDDLGEIFHLGLGRHPDRRESE